MTRARNSLGRPWEPGQTWSCAACGAAGNDRDDDRMGACPAHPTAPHRGPCTVRYAPPEHEAAIRARYGDPR